ncbi:hypothetical protein BH20ACT2_BH20ACT2_24130 [soil metagenome]
MALGELLGRVRGPRRIEGLRRLSGGASRETWAFDAVDPDGVVEALVLQRERPGAVRTGAAMDDEAALLRAAADAAVPVAELVAASGDEIAVGIDLGAPYLVAARLDGETIPRRILRDDRFAGARRVLTADCVRALAAIHRIPIDAVPGLEQPDPVDRLVEVIDAIGQPSAAFELGLRALQAGRPPAGRTTVVHGDFRNGNLIVGPEGLRAVLDWELAHRGDPLEDLGWLCVRAWRFGAQAPVGGFGEIKELLALYEEASGHRIDPAALAWWQALGTLRWGVICLMQAETHRSGAARSVELAAIGRRVCESEHDFMELLFPPDDPAAPPPAAVGGDRTGVGLHGVPTAAELVEAVSEFLATDVAGEVDGRVAFHVRVAVNALGIVQRELASGPAQEAAHRRRLDQLGLADDAALAGAIRAGDLDARRDEIIDAVRHAVHDKLAVANPGYAN